MTFRACPPQDRWQVETRLSKELCPDSLSQCKSLARARLSRLDLLYPDIPAKVEKQQAHQKACHDGAKPLRAFTLGDNVYAKNFSGFQSGYLEGEVW